MKATLLLILIICSLHTGLAIDCFVCQSTNDDCGENANTASLMARGATETGCGSCTKVFSFKGTIWSTTVRACSPATTVYCTNILGHGSCSCTTSFCNGGRSVTSHTTVILSATILLLWIFKEQFV